MRARCGDDHGETGSSGGASVREWRSGPTATGQWGKFLRKPTAEEQGELLRQHARPGRPLGGERLLARLEPGASSAEART